MKRITISSTVLLLAVLGLLFTQRLIGTTAASDVSAQPQEAQPIPAPNREQTIAAFGRLPLSFEENRGQTASEVKFQARTSGYHLFLTSTEAVLIFPARHKGISGGILQMKWLGANPAPMIWGVNQLPGRSNYMAGREPTKWQTNVPNYAKVKYENIYPGIDQIYYGNQNSLEYDLLVAPGANPEIIRLGVEGAERLNIDEAGNLLMEVKGRKVRLSRPIVYQEIDGARLTVECRYVLSAKHEIQLKLGTYDRGRFLVIDPVLQYSTYLGGGRQDQIHDIALDANGNAYVTGVTVSDTFPTTNGAYQTSVGVGFGDGVPFISKLNPSGTALVYSTYLGGGFGSVAISIAVDKSGNAYITGFTGDVNFPTTPGAFQTVPISYGPWAFVTKLNNSGSGLIFSTFLCGNPSPADEIGTRGKGIAIDNAGSVFVVGDAGAGFPTTPGAFQTTYKGRGDAFVARLNSSGSQLIYSTYLGGSDRDHGQAIAIDNVGAVYVSGITGIPLAPTLNSRSSGQLAPLPPPIGNFPVTVGAYQSSLRGMSDFFVAKLNINFSALVYSTFLGGSDAEGSFYNYFSGDIGRNIAIDSAKNVYLTGRTYSRDFPTTAGAYQTVLRGPIDAIVAKLNAIGSGLVYSSYIGGSSIDYGNAIALDGLGSVYVTGETGSRDFPVTLDAIQPALAGSTDTFVVKLNKTGSALIYSTYLGGVYSDYGFCIAVNRPGSAFVGGITDSDNFLTTSGAFQGVLKGSSDGFIAKVVPGLPGILLSRIIPNVGGDGGTVTTLLQGIGFKDGAAVKLIRAGYTDIVGTFTNVSSDGRTIGTVLNLRGKNLGQWDVVVTNPDGTTASIRNGFTIEAGKEALVVVDLPWGSSLIRAGQRQPYGISYRNEGNNDIYGVPIWIKARGSAGLRLVSEVDLPVPLPGEPTVDWTQVPTVLNNSDGGQAVAVMPALLPPGRRETITVEITAPPQIGSQISLEAWANPPIFKQLENPGSDFLSCYLSIIKLVGEKSGVNIPASCDDEIRQAWLSIVANAVQESYFSPYRTSKLLSLPQVVTAISAAAIHCAGANIPFDQVVSAVRDVLGNRDELNKCFGTKISDVIRVITVVRAYDPNDKIGVPGVGTGRFVLGDRLLGYAVFFENLPTATAPAREVVITDQLDVSTMDLSTFSFGPISFGTHIETPTPGLPDFATEVDLRPDKSLIVRINAILDPATGLVTWRFTSINPATGQPPTDPLAGFLPPNINSPEGAGSVLFTVQPKAGLASGAEIRNRASIIFDQNQPIETPVWLNTIDITKPNSQVAALPAVQSSANFEVRWSGTDAGSGIGGYTIYVAVDRGPYLPWLTNTTATSAIYTGMSGRRYSFYSIARDRVGNVEDVPPLPDAVTEVAVRDFDFCVQDDRTGDFLLINSFTGDYVFTHCGPDGFSLSGRGRISRVKCNVTLSSALVNATLESCATNPLFNGQARVKRTAVGPTFLLNDRDLSNNACGCR